MKGIGDHFFTHAAVAGDQDRSPTGSHLLHHFKDLLHRFALADDVGKLMPFLQLLLHSSMLKHQFPGRQSALHQKGQPIHVHRFCEVIVGAVLHRSNGILDGPVSGKDDDRQVRGHHRSLLQYFLPREIRHLQVCNHQVNIAPVQGLDRLFAVTGQAYFVAVQLEHFSKTFPDVLLIIHNQDVVCHCASSL